LSHGSDARDEPAKRVLKTLVAWVDDKPVCLMILSDRELGMKKVASLDWIPRSSLS